jgi:hypothetical protein
MPPSPRQEVEKPSPGHPLPVEDLWAAGPVKLDETRRRTAVRKTAGQQAAGARARHEVKALADIQPPDPSARRKTTHEEIEDRSAVEASNPPTVNRQAIVRLHT